MDKNCLNCLYIIIPVYNRLNNVKRCIRNLYSQSFKKFKIIVIDDGSTDKTSEYIKKHFDDVILLNGDGNLWWAGAVNLGLKYIIPKANKNDYVMTLNDDVYFSKDFLKNMVAFATLYPNTLINPIAIDINTNRAISSGNRMLSWALALSYHPFYYQKHSKIYRRKPTSVHMLTGRGTLIPINVFKRIGIYDNNNFPQYGADCEFSLRANRNGFELLIKPDSFLYVEKKSTGLDPIYRDINLLEVFESFTSIKSTNNLLMRMKFARHCAPVLSLPTYISITLIKIFLQSFIYNYCKRIFKFD